MNRKRLATTLIAAAILAASGLVQRTRAMKLRSVGLSGFALNMLRRLVTIL